MSQMKKWLVITIVWLCIEIPLLFLSNVELIQIPMAFIGSYLIFKFWIDLELFDRLYRRIRKIEEIEANKTI